MGDMTTYLKNKLRDHVLRGIAYTPPASIEMRLYTSATTDAGGGTEVVGGSYVGQTVTFAVVTDGQVDNSAGVSYVDMPADTITNAALHDESGNMLLHGPLVAPRTTSAGDTLTFAASDIDAIFD